MKICAQCGKEFEPKMARQVCCGWVCSRDRKIASQRVTERNAYATPRQCAVCGVEFMGYSTMSKVCSDECRKLHRRGYMRTFNQERPDDRTGRKRTKVVVPSVQRIERGCFAILRFK